MTDEESHIEEGLPGSRNGCIGSNLQHHAQKRRVVIARQGLDEVNVGREGPGLKQFFSFDEWWRHLVENNDYRAGRRGIRSLDPDLATLQSVSLWKRFQMQEERHIRVAKAEARRQFDKALGIFGIVEERA